MAHEVIMPVLGMNQDTAVIAEWNKQQGEFVDAGEVIMSVETDKAVQEIEALHSGYLSHVKYGAGDSVPVGTVVAVLTETAETSAQSDAPETKADNQPQKGQKEEQKPQQAATTADNAPRSLPVAKPERAFSSSSSPSGKILASPKAKRLAAENSILLADLVKSGVIQPIHAKAVEDYRPAPKTSFVAMGEFRASVDSAPFCALLESLRAIDASIDQSKLLACFIAGAARYSGLFADSICVEDATAQKTTFNPDLAGAVSMQYADGPTEAHIKFWDFTGSSIDSFKDSACHDISVAICGQDTWTLNVCFSNEAASPLVAAAFLNELAERLKQPLRQIL